MVIEQDPALARYVRAAQNYRRLSREEETELWHQWYANQDKRAIDTLVRANSRYVIAIASKYRRYGLPFGELIAEGNFGVVHAMKKFEPERGYRFVTYAGYWIRTFILTHIIRSWSLVGAGSGVFRSKMFFKLRRERVRITNLVGEGDRADEILAKRFNTSRVQIVEMMGRLERRDVSLSARVFDSGVTSLVDTLVSPDFNQEDVCVRTQHTNRVNFVVREALDVLDRRERYIVERRLMADPEERLSLADLGRSLGVSRERARQIEVRAKGKLRQRISSLTDSTHIEELSAESAA
jgi:RNA polymerase sigma-32 factor